jgi:hypothetical protein
MQNYKEEKVTVNQKVVHSVTCDVCGKTHTYGEVGAEMEIQEFEMIRRENGYGSIFGDTTKTECDICQYCVKDLLGKYLRTIAR